MEDVTELISKVRPGRLRPGGDEISGRLFKAVEGTAGIGWSAGAATTGEGC